MSSTLQDTLTLEQLVGQAWVQVQAQVRELLRRTIEGLLEAERDRHVLEAQQRGEKVYRWGYTVRKCWTTLWGALHQIRVPRLRRARAAEIGIVEKYQRHSLEAVLFALTVGGLSQRKVVGWVQRFLGSRLSVASVGAVLRQAQEPVQARRSQPLSSARYRALAVDGVYHHYRHTGQRGGRPGVLLVAVGVREGGAFDVLDWLDAAEETAAAYEQLFTQLWQRGLERVELLISDGAPAILSAAAVVYPGAAHQLCLVHWFRNLEALTPRLPWWQRRKLRREFWWIWEADNEAQAREWARRFCQRWRFWAPEMVEKFWAELPRVLAFFRFPARWRHRLRTTNLAEGFFKHLRKYLSRFPGCINPAHSEQVLGCFLLAAEALHG